MPSNIVKLLPEPWTKENLRFKIRQNIAKVTLPQLRFPYAGHDESLKDANEAAHETAHETAPVVHPARH